MGARTWMLVYAQANVKEVLRNRPPLDRDATQRLAMRLFPDDKLHPTGDGDLLSTCPPHNEVQMGCFPGVSILAAKEFAIDYPSKLPMRFISAAESGTTYLHAMHSVVDWLAFAKWSNGELVRSLSLAPGSGILEDIGRRLPFEEPYWSGQHPVPVEGGDYPFSFHPLEMGEAALKEFFGYQLEGDIDPSLIDPESIPLIKYHRKRPWWKLW